LIFAFKRKHQAETVPSDARSADFVSLASAASGMSRPQSPSTYRWISRLDVGGPSVSSFLNRAGSFPAKVAMIAKEGPETFVTAYYCFFTLGLLCEGCAMLMRVIQGLVGFVIGAGFVAALELIGIYLISMASSGRLAPSGIGWFIAPLLAGFTFARACAANRYSKSLEIWFVCAFVWLTAAALYYRYGANEKSAQTALALAAIAYVPVLLSFIGVLFYRRAATR
jgi:hypothetical protein